MVSSSLHYLKQFFFFLLLRYVRMSSTGQDKVLAMLIDTERVADQILVNKQEIVELDKRRQSNREALNELKRTTDTSTWTSIGCAIVKLKKETAIKMLQEGLNRIEIYLFVSLMHSLFVDQEIIERDIDKLRQQQKVLVNKLRDLEKQDPTKGFNLKPMSHNEMGALKSSLRL